MQVSFDKLRFEGLREVIDAVERAAAQTGIDFFLIGAVARDIWMHALHETGVFKGTKDVDFAVFVADEAQYRVLKENLITQEGFSPVGGYELTVTNPAGIRVDLLPFGGALEVEGKISIKGVGVSEIWVNGFREVYQNGLIELAFENQKTYKVSTLPGIVLLKFRAYDDMPDQRVKDIIDIGYIMRYYLDIVEDEIFSGHPDLLDDDYDGDLTAVRVLGRQIRQITGRDSAIAERFEKILNGSIHDPAKSPIGDLLAQNGYGTVENAIAYLRSILQGFHDGAR